VSTAAIVLAAGGSTRFGGAEHKLLVQFRGRPLVSWALAAAAGAGLDEVAVVVGSVDLRAVLPTDVRVITNTDWASGQASSLQAALSWADRQHHQVVVVGLGDQPLIPAEAWTAVASTPSPIAVATFEGRRRPPVRLEQSVWALLPTQGDEGARVLMSERPELVRDVPCPGEPADIDDMEDLIQWS
jgi:CTP:molybdopterin cytidylyltransferase MocA